MAKEKESQQKSEDSPNDEQLTRLWKNAEFVRQFVLRYDNVKIDHSQTFEGTVTVGTPDEIYVEKKDSPYFVSADIKKTDDTSQWLHIEQEEEHSLLSISFGFGNDFAIDLLHYNPTDGSERSYRRNPTDRAHMKANEYGAIKFTLDKYINTVIIGPARN